MGYLSTSIELPATPEQVFDIAADPSSFEKWLTIHSKWKGELPERFSKGAQLTEVLSMMGMPNTITWNVDEFEEPSKVAISGTGMAGVKIAISIDVEPSGSGSTFKLGAEFSGQMIVGALGKAIEKDGQKNLEQSLAKFKELLD